MHPHHRQKTIHEWNDDDKNCWSRKSSLEKKLIILIIVVGVSSIGFLIYFSITHTFLVAKICNTPRCSLAASQILAHIDTTIDPCEDFYKFSCGKLIEDTHGDLDAIRKLGVDELIERQVKEIIEEPINDDDHFLIKSQKLLFQACLNETAIEEESLDIFKETIEELRGWPVVVGYKWHAKRFDWQDMIYELRQRGYDYSMILSVLVAIDLIESSEYTVVISEPLVKSIKDEHKDLYINYMIDVAVKFGADIDFAAQEMKLVWVFMKKLEKIVDQNRSSLLDTDDENWNDEKSRIFTVEEFQSNHTKMEWLEFINTIISPLANISQDDYVLFPNSEFINNLFYLLFKTSKRTQANYIIWTVLQDIMPYMPKELKQLHANYTCSTAEQQTVDDRFDFCKTVVEDSFIPGLTEITYARRYLSEEKKAHVEELFDNIKTTLSAAIMESTWMDEESKGNSSAKADEITAMIGFDEDYFNDTLLESLLIPNDTLENFGNDSFLNLLLKSKKRVTDVWYYQISIPSNDTNIHLTMNILAVLNIHYYGPKNKLLLSPKLLQGVYYNEENPSYLNYGALGSLLAKYLLYGFELNLWTKESIGAFYEKLNCLGQNMDSFGLENSETQNNTITAAESMFDYVGLHLGYNAYKKWVEENDEEEPQLPGIEYTPNQLFWISAILPQCYILTEEEINRNFVAGGILNNPNFSDDFSCSAESKMNPSENCEFV